MFYNRYITDKVLQSGHTTDWLYHQSIELRILFRHRSLSTK